MWVSSTIFSAGFAAAMAAASAFAAEPKAIGQFKDWSAHVLGAKKAKVCYLFSEPKKSEGKYKKRDRAFIQVAHRPKDKVRGEVSITAGYAYQPKSEVEVEIEGKKFKLFTHEDGAWLRNSKDDSSVVGAMRAGKSMYVRGVSARGTKTVDTYSLSGFSGAYKAIEKACYSKK